MGSQYSTEGADREAWGIAFDYTINTLEQHGNVVSSAQRTELHKILGSFVYTIALSQQKHRTASTIIFISQLETNKFIATFFNPPHGVIFWHSTIIVKIDIPVFVIPSSCLTPRKDENENRQNGQQSFHLKSMTQVFSSVKIWGRCKERNNHNPTLGLLKILKVSFLIS